MPPNIQITFSGPITETENGEPNHQPCIGALGLPDGIHSDAQNEGSNSG